MARQYASSVEGEFSLAIWEAIRSFVKKKKLWNGLLMRIECRWSLSNWRLPTQPRLLSCFVIPPLSYSCLLPLLMFLVTFLFTLMCFLQMPLPTTMLNAKWSSLKWKTALWWSLPCNEKILWQTLLRLNKATHSITQCHLTECQKASLRMVVSLLFITILTAGGRKDIYDSNYKYGLEPGQVAMHLILNIYTLAIKSASFSNG